MLHRLRWWFSRARSKLWVRPLLYVLLAIAAVVVAGVSDRVLPADAVPSIDRDTLESLLAIIASSMMAVATLAVASMVSAYASASSTATPRAFSLVVADDVSQTALSGFIGAFIFSIVALTAVKTKAYGPVGLFVAFVFTALIFAMVIMVFLRWVDRIARLGRLGTTIDRVERAARDAIDARRCSPVLGGVPLGDRTIAGWPATTADIGYVQSIDMGALQRSAERAGVRIVVRALPGTFATPDKALATVEGGQEPDADLSRDIARAFIVGDDRTFEKDPRFGLITLAEIAARALSPAVNDPGTAIDIIGTFVRLFARWTAPEGEQAGIECDRVLVPELSPIDMFDDAFTAIGRDGAGCVEVVIRLQKAFAALALLGDDGLRQAAARHARLSLARAELALKLPEEIDEIRRLAADVERLAVTPFGRESS